MYDEVSDQCAFQSFEDSDTLRSYPCRIYPVSNNRTLHGICVLPVRLGRHVWRLSGSDYSRLLRRAQAVFVLAVCFPSANPRRGSAISKTSSSKNYSFLEAQTVHRYPLSFFVYNSANFTTALSAIRLVMTWSRASCILQVS